MTEYDRGAYTPQPDAPLQFDARGPRGRKPMPMTLIGSGAVLVVLLGALALHYRHDTKATPDAARPVGEPVAQVKAAAPATAQPKDATGSVDVFGGAKAPAKAPTFAAAPEAPKPRAQLTIQSAEPTAVKTAPLSTSAPTPPPAVAVKAAPVALAKAAPAPAAPTTAPAATTAHPTGYIAPTVASVAKPAPTTAAKPTATEVVAKLAATPVAKPAPATSKVAIPAASATASTKVAIPATAAAAKTTAAKPAAGGVVLVQIGAYSSVAQSDKGWADVSAAMSGAMAGKSKRVETLDKDGKTLYRTSVAGFSSRSAADAFCKALAAKGHICFAKG